MKLLLTVHARHDIGEIDDFTTARWGAEQSRRYILAVRAACEQLARAPHTGRTRAGLPPGILVRRIGRHFVVYRLNIELDQLEILNILHTSMNIEARVAKRLGSTT